MIQVKTYRFNGAARRLKPTQAQAQCFAQWLGSCRYVYNLCLDYKKQLYTDHSISISKNDIQKEIAAIAKEVDWIGQIHSQTLQEVTDRLFKAYDGFFKSGKGFPQFAKKGVYSSFSFKQGVKLHQNTSTVQLPKIGKVKYRKSQAFDGQIKTANISKQADGWYISLVCEVDIEPLPAKTNTVGLDVGIKSLATFSDGRPPVENPNYLYHYQKRLTKAQRSVSRKKKGGSNRKKAVQKLARIHLKIKNTRKDFHHQLSTRLIGENPGGEPQTIVVENLQVANLLKNHQLAKAIRAASVPIVVGTGSLRCWNTRPNGTAEPSSVLLHNTLRRIVLSAGTATVNWCWKIENGPPGGPVVVAAIPSTTGMWTQR